MLNLVQAIIKYPPATGQRNVQKPVSLDNTANKTNHGSVDFVKELVESNKNELSSPSILKSIHSLTSKDSASMVDLMRQLNNELQGHSQTPGVGKLVQLLTSMSTTHNELIVNSENIERQLKGAIPLLGLDYEQKILSGEGKNSDSIKSLLLQLLEESPSTKTNEKAEALLNRITGLQLQANDSGPLTQFLMQIPLFLGQKANDVTIQWTGRKTDPENIDPNHCRVLFYLDLENLKETTVDLHIQNRVINIVIYNKDEKIQGKSHKYISLLKHVLGEMDYHLSQVKFKVPAMEQHFSNVSKQTTNFKYSGVDLKI